MLYSGTDPESYITEYTLVYDDYYQHCRYRWGLGFLVSGQACGGMMPDSASRALAHSGGRAPLGHWRHT